MTAEDRPPRRLGILAGGGSVPGEIAKAAMARGWPVHIVAIDGEADADFAGLSVTRVNWGQIGGMIRSFKQHDVSHLVIIGRVSRPDLTRMKPDFGLLASIPRILKIIAAGGDDGVLRKVISFFEDHGFKVLGPADVAPALVIGAGSLGRVVPAVDDERDIAIGLDIVRRLGPFDVGQCVAVAGGNVLAIEGAEGTDRMLARVAAGRAAVPQPRSGVLVKRPKPGQEMRIDMPTIGPQTADRVAQAGLSGIAVLAGQVLATERDELSRRADAEGIFVAGVAESQDAPPSVGRSAILPPAALTDRDATDAARAVAVVDCLSPVLACRGVVVARNYVLAIETGEGIDALLQRVGGLRQWGSARLKRRSGIVVLAREADLDAVVIDRAADGGLRGLAVLGPPGSPDLPPNLVARARARRLVLFRATTPAAGGRP